ncbi:U11/U12 small nuclear ribonucleoprotein 48 kDa protein [Sesamum indicum]|uniref:U11/U12 small nuclear ribonucleoprotein 48 kDa protein n=1 Tax=Sesamum indicum TaxID=4182 RepID=A0A6I9T913_SESIN|nr:U11/U12 small nuclear ribonucleoprotein 48 kDa protein [Sesamum indicum]XP_011077075.1 U11/U12 small nuclear ribonucleoprotein 48 kDa protein [Sesamum indicum]XP_011077077.1 U11/U12 small nuclear ribonucleoprotein 48 kDa protein [Sesamum indicum]XP_020549075.1 U11/U12 small nuclear ribonucleoprotein 48 kDa protein [Sesamum indicum]
MNPQNPPPRQLPPPPQPQPAATVVPSQYLNPPPSPSLSAALSNLTPLLHLANTTLQSLPTATATVSASPTLLPCPFNPNHRLPPSSLFSHYLNCPSPVSLSHTFHYPLTLHSCATTPSAAASFPTTSSDLCVSLESYIGYNSPPNNFFYQNCPGPVTPSVQPPPLLNLPRELYIECADYNQDSSHQKAVGFSVDFVRFLPSEIWAIRSEIEAWGGSIPSLYSSRILRAIMRLKDFKLFHLYEWIVANSPRYGVIIDFAMRDHVVLLVRLCLKLIVREAFGLAGVTFIDKELKLEGNELSGLSNRNFECPTLVKMVMWLASQFRILYGEVNGNFFAVDVLKECISESALCASLFRLERKDAESSDFQKVDGEVEEPVQSITLIDGTRRDEGENIKGVTVGNSTVLISQVAAAVAALHERSLIEEKIKALRNSRPLSAYQRNLEHAYMSKIADEERQKRPDYRPIIEHDGFLRQRSGNQDGNKAKTREELLAEERDYKRRRMSYRGKKLKRNTLEVMRDIIEEFMEEIKQAGGVDGTSKAAEEMGALTSDNLNTGSRAAGVSGTSQIPEEIRGQSLDYRKDSHARHDSKKCEDDIHRLRRDSSWDHRRQDLNKSVGRVRHDKDDNYRSWDGRQSGSDSRERMDGRENQEFVEALGEGYSRRSRKRRSESRERDHHKISRDEHEFNNHKRERDQRERTSRKRERYEDNREREDRGRSKTERASRHRDEDGGYLDRRKSKTNRSSSSRLELQDFDDRYDPAESRDFYEDDF